MVWTLAVATAICTAIWYGLTEGEPTSWLVGVPAVAAAVLTLAWLDVRLPQAFQIRAWANFAWFFLSQSVVSGFDVAWRVVQPRLKIDPALMSYRSRLREPASRAWFMTLITMLPGTLSVAVENDRIEVHLLHRASFDIADLERLEVHVGRLTGDAEGWA